MKFCECGCGQIVERRFICGHDVRIQHLTNRIDVFKQQGYDTLVLWEHEFRNVEGVMKKVKEFASTKSCVNGGYLA